MSHIYREVNNCADLLANLGHRESFNLTIVVSHPPPSYLSLKLHFDVMRCKIHKLGVFFCFFPLSFVFSFFYI